MVMEVRGDAFLYGRSRIIPVVSVVMLVTFDGSRKDLAEPAL